MVRGLKIEQVFKPPKRQLGIIYLLGVAPEHRSKGIGRQLIQYSLAQIQQKGMDRAALNSQMPLSEQWPCTKGKALWPGQPMKGACAASLVTWLPIRTWNGLFRLNV